MLGVNQPDLCAMETDRPMVEESPKTNLTVQYLLSFSNFKFLSVRIPFDWSLLMFRDSKCSLRLSLSKSRLKQFIIFSPVY